MTKIFDVQFASHLLDENLQHNNLKYLTRTYLGKEVVEYDEAIQYGVNSPQFARYAIDDAINTYELGVLFSRDIERQGLHHLAYDIEFPFARVLTELNINGVGADVNTAQEMIEQISHLQYQFEDEMLQVFNKTYETKIKPKSRKVYAQPQINFNSGQQVAKCLQSLGINLTERTKKGKLSTTTKVLEKLKNDIERKLSAKKK